MSNQDTSQGQLNFSKSVKVPITVKKNVKEGEKAAAGSFGAWRKKRLYDPNDGTSYALSRSKVDMFLKCPRCFYLEQRLGIKIPSGPGFSLNSAVDCLLKKEFDIRRAEGVPHPLMEAYGIEAVPARHEDLEVWRENFKGIRTVHKPTNFELFGAIDDLWVNPAGEFHIVDYKSTSTVKEISLEDQYKKWYKIQAEFYQWLFRACDFKVSDTAYFVFANATKDRKAFDAKLEFAVTIITHEGDDSWVEGTLEKMKDCLDSDNPPDPVPECEYCQYIEKARSV